MIRVIVRAGVCSLLLVFALSYCAGQDVQTQPICPRPIAGANVTNPPEIKSHNGLLELGLHLRYEGTLPSEGPPRYCYVTDDGLESPTLRVLPGDVVIIHLHNDLPPVSSPRATKNAVNPMSADDDCGGDMNSSVTNLHFHGMAIPPLCHQDEVIRTAIQAGQSFDYRFRVPADQAPGLYWYHPHPHGFTERQIQGGASGAIIVAGIEARFPAIASLPSRIILLRDQQRIGPEAPGPAVPTWDISANFVPIVYPENKPALIAVTAGGKEFWRVVNAASDTIFNLQVLINGIAQPIQTLAIDGVPVARSSYKQPIMQTNVFLPPGARVEFVVSTPAKGASGELVTRAWNTGPAGDNDTERTIARVVSSDEPGRSAQKSPRFAKATKPTAFRSNEIANVTQRNLYFSQRSSNPQDPDNFVLYFITVQGQSPAPYKMGLPPNIVVHQGHIEDWTIENRSQEDHVFHIHQIHFQVLKVNGKLVNDPAMRDTIDIPYWSGSGPYPAVTLRMNFNDPKIVGTFLYHCHILKHEDMGMMGSIQVLPPQSR
jgi:FtsP/CotA-like multicopper oxidase with cupredoxin domain